jgi:phytoene synthase
MSGEPRADAAIAQGSKSFALASRLFDARTRHLVWDLYTWCRHLDDRTDGQALGHGHATVTDTRTVVADLRIASERALRGEAAPGTPFAALARVAAATGLPAAFVHDHLTGFEMDAAGTTYESPDDTDRYCYHVAGVVGLMMAWIMGVRDRDVLLRGCDLGLAFQLTNIVRDVQDDALNGRVYVPACWLKAEGAVIALGQPLPSGEARLAVLRAASRLLDRADACYASAWHGVAALPWRSGWAVATARHVYGDIGPLVRRAGDRAWDTRASTSTGRKVARLLQALVEVGLLRTRPWRHTPTPRTGLFTPSLPPVLG